MGNFDLLDIGAVLGDVDVGTEVKYNVGNNSIGMGGLVCQVGIHCFC